MEAKLRPFLRLGLDVLFIALNPPVQSNDNCHYFSGKSSRFFHLLGQSGLTLREIPKLKADEVVFGGTSENFNGAAFGVVDLVEDLVESNSSKVRPKPEDVSRLVTRIRKYEPKFACIIHSKVLAAVNRWAGIDGVLDYGYSGKVLPGCHTEFFVNYFPNGNSIKDAPKIEIFEELRSRLGCDP